MRKLYGQIKLQCKINGPSLSSIVFLSIMGLLVSAVYLNSVAEHSNMASLHVNSIIASYFLILSLVYVLASSFGGFTQSIQCAVAMSSTRRSYIAGSIVFYILVDFVYSTILIVLLITERSIYSLRGFVQNIEIFNIMNFETLNIDTALSIFLVYFSTMLALSGMAYFLNSFVSSILKEKAIKIVLSFIIFSVFLSVQLTQLKIFVLNFLVNNMVLMLCTKFTIIGLCGFVFSWPFIEKMDMQHLG